MGKTDLNISVCSKLNSTASFTTTLNIKEYVLYTRFNKVKDTSN